LKPSNAKVEHVRKTGIPPTHASIFDLKTGDVSQVFDDPGGFMIYKIEAVEDLPITSVHDEIVRKLETDKIKSSFDALQNSAKTTLDEAYFATPAPPTLRNPGEAPAAQTPPPGKSNARVASVSCRNRNFREPGAEAIAVAGRISRGWS